MKGPTLLRIGEFAQIGQVSVATLRHYEKLGLLQPHILDPDTGYRYYTLDQLPRLNRILALKELDFPLAQIAQLLEEHLSLEQLHGMFKLKQAQTQYIIDEEQARLTRLAVRLRQIEQGGKMPAYEVLLKHVDPLLVASMRDRIPSVGERGPLYETLSAYLKQQGVQQIKPDLVLLHSRHELHDDGMSIDVEVAIPLSASVRGNERIGVRTLPGGLVACTVYMSDNPLHGQAYAALHSWVQDNGYRLIGPPRLVYLQRADDVERGQHVTEVQFPVDKQ